MQSNSNSNNASNRKKQHSRVPRKRKGNVIQLDNKSNVSNKAGSKAGSKAKTKKATPNGTKKKTTKKKTTGKKTTGKKTTNNKKTSSKKSGRKTTTKSKKKTTGKKAPNKRKKVAKKSRQTTNTVMELFVKNPDSNTGLSIVKLETKFRRDFVLAFGTLEIPSLNKFNHLLETLGSKFHGK